MNKVNVIRNFKSVSREEEAIRLDGLNVSQMKAMREKAEKFQFQAEIDRMMKLIINSLYTNKEVGISINRNRSFNISSEKNDFPIYKILNHDLQCNDYLRKIGQFINYSINRE